MPLRDATVLRLELPCPHCGDVFSTSAYAHGGAGTLALFCLHCGHGRVEPTEMDPELALRAVLFWTGVEDASSGAYAPGSLALEE